MVGGGGGLRGEGGEGDGFPGGLRIVTECLYRDILFTTSFLQSQISKIIFTDAQMAVSVSWGVGGGG